MIDTYIHKECVCVRLAVYFFFLLLTDGGVPGRQRELGLELLDLLLALLELLLEFGEIHELAVLEVVLPTNPIFKNK